jgi:hypothetical protein
MTYRPGRLKRMVEIDLPRPRSSEIVSSTAFEEASRGMQDAEERSLHAGERSRAPAPALRIMDRPRSVSARSSPVSSPWKF